MYLFYFDSGTTNSRGYLLKHRKILGMRKVQTGSKDVSVTGDRKILITALRRIYDELLREHKLLDQDIDKIYASGMITSPYGLKEVPHTPLPLDFKKMAGAMVHFYEDSLFHRNIFLVPGAKTTSGDVSFEEIHCVNNTRGEEIEVMGICRFLPQFWKEESCIVLLPGSHTHAMLLKGNTIVDILSNFSGELFHALTSATILSSETKAENEQQKATDPEAVRKGCFYLQEFGLARAIYIVHATKMFDVSDNGKRRDMLSGIVAGTVMQSLVLNAARNWPKTKKLIIYGSGSGADAYAEAAAFFAPKFEVMKMDSGKEGRVCAVEGLLSLIDAGKQEVGCDE